jgi:predicted PurR-regulated permease PerM
MDRELLGNRQGILRMNEPPTSTLPSDTEDDRPTLDDLIRAFKDGLGIRSLALTGLFVLALFYTLYFARGFVMSVTVALLLSFLFSPMVRALKRARIPEAVGAAVVLAGALALCGTAVYQLSGPVSEWMAKAPEMFRRIEGELKKVKKPVEKVTAATEQVEKLADVSGGAQTVQIRREGLSDTIVTQAMGVMFEILVVLILLYFLLASGDLFLRKLVTVLPTFEDKKRAVQIARETEDSISVYLLTVAAINTGLGVMTAALMWWIGMPNPVLWGVLAGLTNFVPYVGAIATALVLTLVALATFGSLQQAIMAPLLFLTLTSIEGYLFTPMMLGRRLTLNPVIVFVSLMFWGWLWGMPGALMAVPLTATFKIFCDHIEPLSPIGELMGK